MATTVAKKMGIAEGSRAYIANAPEGVIDSMDLPELDITSELRGEFDYLHLFVKSQQEFHDQFPRLKSHLKSSGSLWVSWPKSGKLGTDLSLTTVIKLGYDYGLVESKTISVDATWSAIKFTHPKAGKVYKNSYGKLNS